MNFVRGMYTVDLNMAQCVSAIVIGLNEVPAVCHLEHNFTIQDSDSGIWQTVIKNFSGEGQTVLIIKDTVESGTMWCNIDPRKEPLPVLKMFKCAIQSES